MLLVMQEYTAFKFYSSCWRTIQQKEFHWRHTEASSSLKLGLREEKREKERKNVTLRADELLFRAFLCVLLRGISALRYTPRYRGESNYLIAVKTPRPTKIRTAHSH